MNNSLYTWKHRFGILLALAILVTISGYADYPTSFSGKPPVETARVRAFANTIAIAQKNADAATAELKSGQNSPENASGTGQAAAAIKKCLQLGSQIVEAEKLACAETGMSEEDFHEVKIRLLQVRMLQTLNKMTQGLTGEQSGEEMAAESGESLERKLAGLERRLARSREDLEKAKQNEAPYFAKLDTRIAEQKADISKLQAEIAAATDADKRAGREKKLAAAQNHLIKLETDRKQPYKKLVQARERVAKHEKSVEVFRKNMGAAQQQIASMGAEIQQFQNKVASESARVADSAVMQQAALDLPVFQNFPELQPFLVEPSR